MEQKALFVGHMSFKNKSGKQMYMLQFLVTQKSLRGVESNVVSVFTDQTTFDTYINSTDMLGDAILSVRISQDRVFYELAA